MEDFTVDRDVEALAELDHGVLSEPTLHEPDATEFAGSSPGHSLERCARPRTILGVDDELVNLGIHHDERKKFCLLLADALLGRTNGR